MPAQKILIVDDENDIRELVSDILDDEGYEVITAANAEQADLAYRQYQPDLVLLDIWMPDCDGISLLEKWQKDMPLSCPVVMMSGHGNVETAVQATRLGALDFIEKPVALNKLLAMVDRSLQSHQPETSESIQQARLTQSPPVGNSHYRKALRQQLQTLAANGQHFGIAGEPGTCGRDLVHWMHSHSAMARLPLLFDQRALQSLQSDPLTRGCICISAPAMLTELQQQQLHSWATGSDERQPRRLIICAAVEFDDLRQQGSLSALLYDLLGGELIMLQPLRHHLEDVPLLLRYYSELLPDQNDLPYRHFSLAAQNQLRQFQWPGNELQLRKLVRQLLLLGGNEEISAAEASQQLQLLQQQPSLTGINDDILNQPLRQAREAFERYYLHHHLQQTDGSVGALADKVGMERTHLYRKLRGLGLDPRRVNKSNETLTDQESS